MEKNLNVIYNYFPDKTDGVVVECGTSFGNMEPSVQLEKSGWSFIGFEPDPRYFPHLVKNRPNALNLPLALSNANELVEFEMSAWVGNSSLSHSKDHTKELLGYQSRFEDGSAFKKVWVSTITWDTFIIKQKIKSVDFMILDVEGSELNVLEGMKISDVHPDVLCIEFAYSDHNNSIINEETKENFSGFKILKDDLESMGYEFDYLNDNNLMFSKKTFWENKEKPTEWFGEDEQFFWSGYCQYDKEKCKNL